MKPVRTLRLRREILVELANDELRGVVAAGSLRVECLPPTLTDCPNYYCTGTC